MKTRTAACAALLTLAALTAGCGSSDDKPSEPSTSTTPAKAYTYEDCVALLEYDFTEGQPQDASGDPECSHLTRDRYKDAVAEVLTAHKDEILEDAQ
ncbi:hypothetical protein ACPCJT_20260 [Streptomyces griseoincarnatus]